MERTWKWNTCRAFLNTVAVAERASVWLPSSLWPETFLPISQEESAWKSPPQLLLLTGVYIHTLGFSFLIERIHHLPKARSLQLDLRGHFCRFSPFALPNPIDFFSLPFGCADLHFFQNFKNWNTFEHPYLLPPFVSTPLKQNSRNLSDVYNSIGSFYSLCPKIFVTKYSLSHLAFLEIFKIKVINDFHFDYIYMKISYVIYYIFIY